LCFLPVADIPPTPCPAREMSVPVDAAIHRSGLLPSDVPELR
jgi:hypothetical protein